MSGTGRFTSGITGCNHFIISMEDYYERDIPIAWELSKAYQGLDEDSEIDVNDYKERYLTVKWEGNVFSPTIHKEKVRGSKLVRIFEIKNNKKNVLEGHNKSEECDV